MKETVIGKLCLFRVSRLYKEGLEAARELEKGMLELNSIVGENVEADERISDLIVWYREECRKRPENFRGDELVVELIKNAVISGSTFNAALEETIIFLKYEFALIDNARATGKSRYEF